MNMLYIYQNLLPYLSVLKPGSYTRRGLNIHWVVQQNEWNKCLDPFKHRVPKLLNLINIKIALWKISLSSISLLMCASSFWMLIQSIVYSVFITFVVFPQNALTRFVSEWSPCTFINVLASNHVIKLINTGILHLPFYPGLVNNRK